MRLPGRRWLTELGVLATFYLCYDVLRNSVTGSFADASRNAQQIISLERHLGMFHEWAVQQLVVEHRLLMQVINSWYGWIHFAVPMVTIVMLLWRNPARARTWRNTFVALCALGLLGFALYPLLPPRLLPEHYGFIDTMVQIGGPGIRPQSAADVGNAYAAMPSLHAGWSAWCALALFPVVGNRAARVGLVLYPFITAFVIMATANHYALDFVAGWLTLAAARGLAELAERAWDNRRRLISPDGGFAEAVVGERTDRQVASREQLSQRLE
jgi:hypothetical protein